MLFGAKWREIGIIGSLIQFFAATIFWISTVVGIPRVIDMDNIALTNGIYWVPQVIGGSGFIIARYASVFSFPVFRTRVLFKFHFVDHFNPHPQSSIPIPKPP